MDYSEIERTQRALCGQYSASFAGTPPEVKLGFALGTTGLQPIHGVRHLVSDGTSGWYIWCGQDFSESADFFDPLHAGRIYAIMPDVGRLLGLPPGYRFLLAENYLDVWFDEKLLVA